MHIGQALARSGDPADRELAASISRFVAEMSITRLPYPPATTIDGPGESHLVRGPGR
jgi:hypothetical protein